MVSLSSASLLFRLVVPAVILGAQAASAGIVVYSRTVWDGLVTTTASTDFEGIAPAGGSQDYDSNTDLVLSGITFHGYYNDGSGIAFASNALSVVDPALCFGTDCVFSWGSGAVLFGLADYAQGGAGGSIKITLPSGVNSVAFDAMGYNTDTGFNVSGYGMGVLAQFYTGDNLPGNLIDSILIGTGLPPNPTSFGFVSTSGDIQTVVLSPIAPDASTYAFPLYDNFAVGSVPEPGTWFLSGGAIALALLRRRIV